jgi:hypothetical protein
MSCSDLGSDVYDTSEKQRIPAWTGKRCLKDAEDCIDEYASPFLDRVLFKGRDVSKLEMVFELI